MSLSLLAATMPDPLDTIDQMEQMARGLENKQLRYEDLVAD